jgi:hypothetical protein
MSKALFIFITLFLICCSPSKRDKAERAEAKRIEQFTKLAVSQMVSRNNAIDDWGKSLNKDYKYRSIPILTIEIEQLWLTGRPILFIGSINDIATYNDTEYTVLIGENFWISDYLPGVEVKLSLLCPKKKIDAFLKEHKNMFLDIGSENGVAVVAKIYRIRTTYVPREYGNGIEVKVKMGEGELLEILYTGNLNLREQGMR